MALPLRVSVGLAVAAGACAAAVAATRHGPTRKALGSVKQRVPFTKTPPPDPVDRASFQSFPASDPPPYGPGI